MTETVPAPPLVGDRVRMYELMVLIRSCDERIRRGLSGGEFACTYWPATGQEAIAAALGTVLRIEDQLVSTYRGLHDQIAKGVPLGPWAMSKDGSWTRTCAATGSERTC